MSQILTTAKSYRTMSGLPLDPVYGPDQAPGLVLEKPGEFPYTRGIHETMYRGKLWTMRQFAGFATAEETNARYHYRSNRGRPGSRWRSISRR
jgi:methylmalonyl-CoA mutase N-terminal domain/subunit